MIEPLRTALLRLTAPTGLLALATALVLLLASLARVDSNGLLILALVYALGGAAGVYRRRVPVSAAPAEEGGPRTLETMGAADLNELATRMLVTVDGLVRAAEAINEVATQQSGGASEQVDVIQLTSSLLDDFLELSERINEQARAVTETAQQAAEISGRGQAAIREAIDGMDTIRSQVEAIGTTIMGLAMLTRKVDEIISSVSEIATQSNLLALNASIEAARAGAHGRGFAVVADEVRALAQQSTQAAQQVGAILVNIQSAMKETVKATEMGMQGVDAGMNKTQEANTVMVQLAANVNASHDAVRAIYSVIRQQSEGLEEIAISMERIDRITQRNLASTRMVETVSTNLTRLAADLQQTVEQSQKLAGE